MALLQLHIVKSCGPISVYLGLILFRMNMHDAGVQRKLHKRELKSTFKLKF